MMHIPFKPLSERMLHEPFWLGLITVTVVLGVIGLIWCAKRHFPEKLEKLLDEEPDRNRTGINRQVHNACNDSFGYLKLYQTTNFFQVANLYQVLPSYN